MKLLTALLVVLAIFGLYYVFCGYTESFVNRATHATFPESQDSTILVGDYPVKQPQSLSKNSYSDNSSMRSTSPIGSYEQVTNNKKNWGTPDNGNCTTADFCDSMYATKQIKTSSIPAPNDLSVRVNYYNIE